MSKKMEIDALRKRIEELEAENKRLVFELQQHHEQSKYVVTKLEAENKALREELKRDHDAHTRRLNDIPLRKRD